MFYHTRKAARQAKKEQLFLRAMTGGNLAERDRLITYTVGEFYNEFSLFLEETAQREKEMQKMRK